MTERRLPFIASSFVGRRTELDALSAELAAHRVLSVTGPAGVGKSRLALEAAQRWPSPSYFASLAGVREGDDVVRVICKALGVEGEQTGGRSLGRVLGLRGPALLVLDGCDELVPTAKEVLSECSSRAEELRLVLTSNVAVGITGERRFEVDPLSLDGAGGDDGTFALLLDRIRTATGREPMSIASRETLLELARRLDGLPLNVELTAGLMGVLSPEELLARSELLLDVPDETRGKRSLRHTLTIAWERLGDATRRALAALSVFRSTFDLEAATYLLADEAIDGAAMVVALRDLKHASLLRSMRLERGSTRYALFDSVRSFAMEQLRKSGEEERILGRHAEYFGELAKRSVETGEGPGLVAASERLSAEEDDLRATVERNLTDPKRARSAALAMSGISWLLLGRGPLGTSAALARKATDACLPHLVEPKERFLFAFWTSTVFRLIGDLARASTLTTVAVDSAREAHDETLVGRALVRRARTAHIAGAPETVWSPMIDEALACATRQGDAIGELQARFARWDNSEEHDVGFDPATQELAERTEDPILLARAHAQAAEFFAIHGRNDDALRALHHLSVVAERLGHPSWRALVNLRRAWVFLLSGELTRAADELGEAVSLARRTGYSQTEGECELLLGLVALEQRRLEDALDCLERSERLLPPLSRERTASLAARAVADAALGRESSAVARRRELASSGDARGNDVVTTFMTMVELELSNWSTPQRRSSEVTKAVALAEAMPPPRSLIGVLAQVIFRRTLERMGTAERTLRVAGEAAWFQFPGQDPVSLEARPVLRCVLWLLVRERLEHPGKAIPRDVVIAEVWPEERGLNHTTNNRLNVALTALRKLGFKEHILVDHRGIRLAEDLPVAKA